MQSAVSQIQAASLHQEGRSFFVCREQTPTASHQFFVARKSGVAKISKALKRTIGATAVKARQLGVSLARS
jgi:hypothetical protein